MILSGIIHEPLYDYNGRKYITISLAPTHWEYFRSKDEDVNCPSFENGNLRVKIPFRYRRPICKVKGISPIRSFKHGDVIYCDIKFTGTWNIEGTTGTTWVANSVEKV